MIINSFKDLYNLSKEISYFKREFPKIKNLFGEFDKSENPKDSLEKIISAARLNPLTDDFLKISKTYDMIQRAEDNASKHGWPYACLESTKEFGVNVKLLSEENIPLDGSSLYLTNHPYGLLDSAAVLGEIGSVLEKNSRKIKFVAMNQLRFIEGIDELLHFIHCTTRSSNIRSLRNSIEYLKDGGNLAICPAGTMSGPGLKEYPWKNEISSFINYSDYVVPVWTSGPNHEGLYNLLARNKKTEKLRRVLSLREAWNKEGKDIYVNIGKPILSKLVANKIKNSKDGIDYIRRRAEALKIN